MLFVRNLMNSGEKEDGGAEPEIRADTGIGTYGNAGIGVGVIRDTGCIDVSNTGDDDDDAPSELPAVVPFANSKLPPISPPTPFPEKLLPPSFDLPAVVDDYNQIIPELFL